MKIGNNLLFSVLSSVIVLVLSLCLVASAQAGTPVVPVQPGTPEAAFSDALFGGGNICPRLNQTPSDQFKPGTPDLISRCNEVARTENAQNDKVLSQIAAEDVAAQGTNSVKISSAIIGARIAALRLVSKGIGLGGLALNINDQGLPDTPVASQGLALNSNEQTLTSTQFASLLSFAISNQVPADETSPFKKLGIFANGEVTFGDKDVTSREPGFDFDTLGFTVGSDYRFTDNFFLGAAFSFAHTDVDLDQVVTLIEGGEVRVDAGSLDTNAYSGSIYGSYYVLEKLYIDGIVSFGFIDFDIDRNIIYNIGTDVDVTAKEDTDATQFSFSFGAGYDFNIGGFTFGPLAQLNYLRVDIDGYREGLQCVTDDAGNIINPGCGWALDVGSQDVDSLISVFGVQGSYALSTKLGVFLPQVRFEWLHEFLDDSRTITTNFVNDPAKQAINFSTDAPDRNFFNLGGGVSAAFARGISAFVYYETVLGLRDISAHNFVGGVRVEL